MSVDWQSILWRIGAVSILIVLAILAAFQWDEIVRHAQFLLTVSLFFVAFLALSIVVAAAPLMMLFPTARRFVEVHDKWGTLKIDPAKAYQTRLLGDFVKLRLEEVSDSSNPPELVAPAKHTRLGNLTTVVARPTPPLRGLARELQYYCGGFVILLAVGILSHVKEIKAGGAEEAILAGGFLPMLELLVIVSLLIRVGTELSWLRSLMEGE